MSEIDTYTDFLFYNSEDGTTKVQVVADPGTETIWTTQKGMSEIFGVEINTVNYHLKEIFAAGELNEDSVIRKIRITAADGKKYLTNFYNLDAIISVGYRVNSAQATKFRIWATGVLKEYMIKGFALDDERLKQGGKVFDKNYFDELLERVKEIRASERMFYQKLTDIFTQSKDYDPKSEICQNFYASVQNKLEYAVIGQTAAEIIHSRADHKLPMMGLMTWKDQKKTVQIAPCKTVQIDHPKTDEIDHSKTVVESCR